MPSSHRITSCRMVMPQEGKSQSDKARRSCVVGFLLSLWLFFLCTWASLEFFTWIMTAKYYFHEDICILTYTWPIRVESLLIKYREVTNWGILHSLIKQNPEPYLPLVLSVWIPLVPPHCLQGELLPPVMLRSKHGPNSFPPFSCVELRQDGTLKRFYKALCRKVKGCIEAARNMKTSKIIHNSSHPPQQTWPSHFEENVSLW